jgi:hypothetical protein
MFVLVAIMVRELGIMHLVDGYESYKIALGVVMHVLGRIEGLSMRIGKQNVTWCLWWLTPTMMCF